MEKKNRNLVKASLLEDKFVVSVVVTSHKSGLSSISNGGLFKGFEKSELIQSMSSEDSFSSLSER